MNDDNRLDDLIRTAAAGHNSPPETPREEMWAAIDAARVNPHGTVPGVPRLFVVPAVTSATGRPVARESLPELISTRPRFGWLSMAAAAVLLVATGVGIGKWTTDSTGPARRIPAKTAATGVRVPAIVSLGEPGEGQAAELPNSGEGVAAESQDPLRVAEPSAVSTNRPRSGSFRSPMASPVTSRADRRVATGLRGLQRSPSTGGFASDDRGTSAAGSQSVVPYQVATIRHLTDAEALLTSFTLESREQQTDSRLAGWAKGLLSNTRLLLDSPAGDDPRRAKLLEDLELVLAQIVQLSPGSASQERDLIDGSLRNGAVMTRLRTAIPAGPTRGF